VLKASVFIHGFSFIGFCTEVECFFKFWQAFLKKRSLIRVYSQENSFKWVMRVPQRFLVFFAFMMLMSFAADDVRAQSADVSEPDISVTKEEFEQDKPWRKKKKDKPKKKKSVSDSKKFKRMARDVLGKPHWSDRLLGILDQEPPKIAIHPFDAEDIPVSIEEAQFYVDGFKRELIREADDRYAIVGRQELGAVVSEINEMGTRYDGANPIGDMITRARSDLLAVGALTLKDDKIVLAYKLVETETGRIVSATQQVFKRKQSDEVVSANGLSLPGAAIKAASGLMRDVPSVRKIRVQGIRYQTTGIDTDFSRYFTGLLSDALRRYAASGPRNINSLEVSDFVIEEEVFRGLQLAKGALERDVVRQAKGRDYVLKGTYWVFEHIVEIRLQLTGATGRSIAWRGKVLRKEIPSELKLVPPPAPIGEADRQPLGPNDLYLTSNKGANPSYKIGDKMVLGVRVLQDGFLSCYYLQADNTIFRIFPNRFVTSGHVNGGFLMQIPSASMPFGFEFSPPSGVEAVKCFVTDLDVERKVAAQIGKAAFDPLPISNERELAKIYRSLEDVTLSEASLIVSVR